MTTDQASSINLDAERHRWALARTALDLLLLDPAGLTGMLVSASHGPVHQAYQTLIAERFTITRIPVSVSEERLNGGLDINASLVRSQAVRQPGLLEADTGAFLINGAERLDTTISGILSLHLDRRCQLSQRSTPGVKSQPVWLVFDESREDEPGLLHTALGDRLAMMIHLPDLPWQVLQEAQQEAQHEAQQSGVYQPTLRRADPDEIARIELPEELLRQMATLASALGIDSLRPLVCASRVARAHAALQGRSCVELDDVTFATWLVLAPRATRLPAIDDSVDNAEDNEETGEDTGEESLEENDASPTAESHGGQNPEQDPEQNPEMISEQLLAAAQATLPEHLIAALVRGQAAGRTQGRDSLAAGTGTKGRPCGVRRPRGDLKRQRLNILETLKCAAPRQKLRGVNADGVQRLQVRVEDFRITRFKQPTRTTTVFVVDASGSSALHRLGEAKGAVELLLAECYVRRDRVALISFRGYTATLELPPTRSLVRAKRRLAGLPGGGGTPLATGLDLATETVRQLKQAGETPVVVLMTDGKANIARSGEASRAIAGEDALQAARRLAAQEVRCLLIDTSPRPRTQAAQLASQMKARYLPLPACGAAGLLPGMIKGS